MSDVNVVSTEDSEMSKVREIFERALNAIVAATQLAKEVERLRSDVQLLSGELGAIREHNTRLDVELSSTRESRDQALRDKAAAIEELNQARRDLDTARYSVQAWEQDHGELKAKHEGLKRDHDQALLHNMELEEENKALKARQEQVKAIYGIQPRDVVSGKWQSPSDVIVQPEPTPEQADVPKTGTDPFWR